MISIKSIRSLYRETIILYLCLGFATTNECASYTVHDRTDHKRKPQNCKKFIISDPSSLINRTQRRSVYMKSKELKEKSEI